METSKTTVASENFIIFWLLISVAVFASMSYFATQAKADVIKNNKLLIVTQYSGLDSIKFNFHFMFDKNDYKKIEDIIHTIPGITFVDVRGPVIRINYAPSYTRDQITTAVIFRMAYGFGNVNEILTLNYDDYTRAKLETKINKFLLN